VSAAPPALIRNYTATLNIAGGLVPQAGVYKLVVAILHQNLGVPTRMAGFEEAPLLQFYDAP
jgi:mannose/fructose/N-acetylgalactosamine-specific phosphotransferase system component IIC